jgi:hypothetical protein
MKIQLSSRRTALFCFFLLLLGTSPAVGQKAANHNPQSLNYGFVSPNTRDGLKLDDAIRGMNSAEETSLLIRAKGMGCVVKRRITTTPALGSWSDGAEPSIVLRVYTDEATIRYLMSRLGRDANQKAIIYFHPEPSGSAKIYSVRLRRGSRGFDSVARILDKTGIIFRTLVPTKQELIIYIVDTDSNLSTKIRAAAKQLKGRLTSQTGSASFIGDDADREKGQNIFLKEIADYESKHLDLPPPCTATN